MQPSAYDIHRLTFPGDSLGSANLIATCSDTTCLDTTALEVLHHAFYRVVGHCGESLSNHHPLGTPLAQDTRQRVAGIAGARSRTQEQSKSRRGYRH